ncbi:hypothetical protein NA57DRAFT_80420 [Rhizodiscina lignyota]|uniref:Uncharacterized protein n=1 Tax=Rhizodiscina lignyota TaxID=1504668 RepID=A0A9P4I9T1_9PEZI|nr:hypothetical protein NA57DRAFT_80420 [Rhizodiscina lignyota]
MKFSQSSAILAFAALAYAAPHRNMPISKRQHRADLVLGLNGGFCGVFATADGDDTQTNLDRIGNNGETCTATKGTCSRIGCLNTSAIYICASQNSDFSQSCASVVQTIGETIQGTCSASSAVQNGGPLSGQLFLQDGTNFVIGFGNCNDPASTPPSSYAQPGPNGAPATNCKMSATDSVDGNGDFSIQSSCQ